MITQDWLLAPSEVWSLITEYQKIQQFVTNILVTNDLAERVSN